MPYSLFMEFLGLLSREQWFALAFCSVIVGAAKSGLPGIGTICVPLMAYVFGGKLSTGFLLPILILADIGAVRTYRGFQKMEYIWKLFFWTVVGILLGVIIGNSIHDEGIFKALLGGIIIFCILLTIGKMFGEIPSHYTNAHLFISLIGISGGFATMIGNAAGPIFTLYLLLLPLNKHSFLATRALFFMLINLVKVPFHIFVWDTISWESLSINILLLPLILAGTWGGYKIVSLIPEKTYRWVVLIFITGSSLLLFF